MQSLPFDPEHSIEVETVFPLQVTPFKRFSLSLSLRFLTWLKSPDFRLGVDLFLSATSLLLLLTFLGSGALLGGAGRNWGLVSAGYRPKLGLAPKMAEALRPLFDVSGRLGTKTTIISFCLVGNSCMQSRGQVLVENEIATAGINRVRSTFF